jgi:hypothetical protein
VCVYSDYTCERGKHRVERFWTVSRPMAFWISKSCYEGYLRCILMAQQSTIIDVV